MNKRCSKCGIEKSTSAFHGRSDSGDGLRDGCRACIAADRRTRGTRNVTSRLANGMVGVAVRVCRRCRITTTEDRSSWYVESRRADGLSWWCRPCVLDSNKTRYWADPEKHRRRARRPENRTYAATSRCRVRDEVIRLFGEHCACSGCYVDDRIFLQVDHINGNGAAHRKELGTNSRNTTLFYKWLLNNPDRHHEFRLLCGPCNQSCGTRGVCPVDHRRPYPGIPDPGYFAADYVW